MQAEPAHRHMEGQIIRGASAVQDILRSVVEDAYKRLIAPSIEREVRAELTEKGKIRRFRCSPQIFVTCCYSRLFMANVYWVSIRHTGQAVNWQLSMIQEIARSSCYLPDSSA